jgi:outer membrane protein
MVRLRKVASILGLVCSFSALHAANLISVYNTALQNDPTFKNAEATWMSDSKALPIARAALLPSLNAAGSYGYSWTKAADFASGSAGLTLDQSIFNYSSWAALAGASNTVKASEATYSAAAQTLIKDTIAAYTGVLSAEEQLRVQHAQTQYLLQNLRSTKQQFDVGLKAITEVYDYQSQYDSSVAGEIADQNALSTALETLRASTGVSYKSLRGISGSVAMRTPVPNDINQWSDRALQQNYGIKAAYYTTAASKDAVHGAVGSLLPSLAAEGKYGQTYNAGNTPGTVTTSSAMLNLSVPIFQGGASYATLSQNRYKYLAAQANLTLAQRDAVSAARKDYLSVIADISSVHANRAAVKSAKESLKSNEAGYRVGTKTITDVLQAIQKLYSSEQQKAAAQYKYISDIVSLKYDVGTLSLSDVKRVNAMFNSNFTFSRPLEQGRAYNLQSLSTIKKNSHSSHKAKVKSKPQVKAAHHVATHAASRLNYPLDSNYYALQFYSGNTYKSALKFRNSAANKSELSIVQSKANGGVHYKVVRGWFKKYSAARTEYSKLPVAGATVKPWIVRLTPKDIFKSGNGPQQAHKSTAAKKLILMQPTVAVSAKQPAAKETVVSPKAATPAKAPAAEAIIVSPKAGPVAAPASEAMQPTIKVAPKPVPAAPVQHQHFVPKTLPNMPAHP